MEGELPVTRTTFLVAVAVMASSPAAAASPELCRPFASAATQALIKYAWERAYSNCLNSDEVPPVPATAADALTLVAPLPAAPTVDAIPSARVKTVTITAAPPAAAPPKAAYDPVCARAHPKGYEASTHTYTALRGRKWVRVPC